MSKDQPIKPIDKIYPGLMPGAENVPVIFLPEGPMPMTTSFFSREAALAMFTDGHLSGTSNPPWDGMPPGLAKPRDGITPVKLPGIDKLPKICRSKGPL